MKTHLNVRANFGRSQTRRVSCPRFFHETNIKYFKRGFSLVELIVAVAILGILATMAVPAYQDMILTAQIARARADIRTLDDAINAFFIDRNFLPTQLTDIGSQANIKDPWNHPFQYYNIGTGTGSTATRYTSWNAADPNLNDDYDLYSLGADGQTKNHIQQLPTKDESSDDIVRVGNGSGIELATEY